MFLLLERLNLRWVILIIDSSFAAIAVDVVELVDENGMLFVQRCMIESFDGSDGLLWGSELDEGKSMGQLASANIISRDCLPFGNPVLAHRHEYAFFLCFSDGIQLAQ